MKKKYIITSNIILYCPITDELTAYLIDFTGADSYVPTEKILFEGLANEPSDAEFIETAARESISKFESLINELSLDIKKEGYIYENVKINGVPYDYNLYDSDNFKSPRDMNIEVDYTSLKYFIKNNEIYTSAKFKFIYPEYSLDLLKMDCHLFFKHIIDKYSIISINNNWKNLDAKEFIKAIQDCKIKYMIEFFDTQSKEEDYEILKQLL